MLGMGIGLWGPNVAALSGGGGSSGSAWDPNAAKTSSDWVLSGSNFIATRSSGTGNAMLCGAGVYAGGARYFEVTVNALTGSIGIGFVDPALDAGVTDYLHDWGFA